MKFNKKTHGRPGKETSNPKKTRKNGCNNDSFSGKRHNYKSVVEIPEK